MIDTIKFKIPADNYFLSVLKGKIQNQTIRKYSEDNEKTFYNDHLLVEQYVGLVGVSIAKAFKSEGLYLEFSIPKLVFGYNIYLFYPDNLEEVAFNIQLALQKRYQIDFPCFEEWIIQRLDVCYMWRFGSNQMAHDVLSSLKAFEYPRKKTAVYDTSITHFSSGFSVKFYLKRDEFFDKEYRIVSKVNSERAEKLLRDSEGLLRFEVEYRKKKLSSYFKKDDVFVLDVNNNEVLTKILSHELNILLGGFNPEAIDDREAANKLIKKYGDKTGLHLFTFYLACFRRRSMTLLKSIFSKTRVKKYLDQIADAGVGLITRNKEVKTKLTIPSDLAPNFTNEQVAVATAHGDGVIQLELLSVRRYFEDV